MIAFIDRQHHHLIRSIEYNNIQSTHKVQCFLHNSKLTNHDHRIIHYIYSVSNVIISVSHRSQTIELVPPIAELASIQTKPSNNNLSFDTPASIFYHQNITMKHTCQTDEYQQKVYVRLSNTLLFILDIKFRYISKCTVGGPTEVLPYGQCTYVWWVRWRYSTGHTIIHVYLFYPIIPVQYSNRLTYFGEIRDHKVP